MEDSLPKEPAAKTKEQSTGCLREPIGRRNRESRLIGPSRTRDRSESAEIETQVSEVTSDHHLLVRTAPLSPLARCLRETQRVARPNRPGRHSLLELQFPIDSLKADQSKDPDQNLAKRASPRCLRRPRHPQRSQPNQVQGRAENQSRVLIQAPQQALEFLLFSERYCR